MYLFFIDTSNGIVVHLRHDLGILGTASDASGGNVVGAVNSFEFQPCGRTPQAECLLC